MVKYIALLLLVSLAWSEDKAVVQPPPTLAELTAKPLPPVSIDPADLGNVCVAAHRALSQLSTVEAEAVIGSIKRMEAIILQLQQQAQHQAAQKTDPKTKEQP